MNLKQFLAGLAITSAAQISICLLLILLIDQIHAHTGFIGATILAMIFFSITIYAAAKGYARSNLVRLYIQLIMVAVFLKMLLCLALIIGYVKGFDPQDNHFIWPFLVIYLLSTIYEVIFLERVGREKQNSEI